MTWRTGRKNGRNIYIQHGPEPSDDDKPIGMMDTAALAARVVEAVNAWAAAGEPGKYDRKPAGVWACDVMHAQPTWHCEECPEWWAGGLSWLEMHRVENPQHSTYRCEREARRNNHGGRAYEQCRCSPAPAGREIRKVDQVHYCRVCGLPTGVRDLLAKVPAQWSAHGEAELEPKDFHDSHAVGERDAAPETCPKCEHLVTAHCDEATYKGCLADVYPNGEKAYCPCEATPAKIAASFAAQTQMLADLLIKGESYVAVKDGKLEALDGVPEGAPVQPLVDGWQEKAWEHFPKVAKLATGGIVSEPPPVKSGDWTPPRRMGSFTVPQGIRDLFGPGASNVKVTVTGPGGEKLGDVINRALAKGSVRAEAEKNYMDTIDRANRPSGDPDLSTRARIEMLRDWASRPRDEDGRWGPGRILPARDLGFNGVVAVNAVTGDAAALHIDPARLEEREEQLARVGRELDAPDPPAPVERVLSFRPGLYRCCIESVVNSDAPGEEGDLVGCKHCEAIVFFRDGAWERDS